MASGGFQKMATTAQSSFNRVTSSMERTARSMSRPISSIDQLNSKLDSLRRTRSITVDRSQLAMTNREIARTERQLMKLENYGTRRRSGGSGLGSLVAGVGMAASLGGVIGAGFEAQQQRASFEVMAGTEQGGKLFTDLNKFAQDSIFGKEVFQNAQTMKAFGMETKNVMPTLKMLGDISMGNKDKMNSLTLAYSQIQATGRLMGQDLLQLVNAGFNPLQIISDKTGRSMANLKKDMEKGLITFDMVKGAFESATAPGGQFFDMTNKIAQTDFGKWEAFKGQVSGLAMQFGLSLAPAVGTLIEGYLVPLAGWISTHEGLVTKLAGGVLLLTGVVKGYNMVMAVYNTISGIGSIAIGKLTIAQWLLNAAFWANPITWIVGGVLALIGVIVLAYNKVEWFRRGVHGLFSGLMEFGKLIKDVIVERIKSLLTGIAGLGKALVSFFKGDWSEAWDAGKQAIYDLSGASTIKTAYDGFIKVGQAAKAGYNAGFDGVKTTDKGITGYVDPFTKRVLAAKNPALSVFNNPAPGGSSSGNAPGSNSNPFAGISGDTSKSDRITGGGGKQITIHAKFTDTINIHAQTVEGGIKQTEAQLEEMFLRIIGKLRHG